MKFFLKINNRERVYVQQADLAMFYPFIKQVPQSVKDIHGGPLVLDLNGYVCFDKPEDIVFFKKQDWIIDFEEVKSLTSDKILENHKLLGNQMKVLLDGDYTKEDRNKLHLLEHKYNTYTKLLWADINPLKMKLPLVPNLDYHAILENDIYMAYPDLKGTSIIIFRKDNKSLTEDDLASDFVSEITRKHEDIMQVAGFESQAKILDDKNFIAVSKVVLKRENSFYNRMRSLIKKKY